MENLTNYHGHCSFCDGHAEAEAFILEAIRQGFQSYGFSSHAPLPFPTRWTLKKDHVQAYLNEINRLKNLYKNQIEIYVGLEIDYLSSQYNPSITYFKQLPLDYRIGSVHLLEDKEGAIVDIDVIPLKFKELIETHFDGNLEATVKAYYYKLMCMVETGGFDIVGHADKISLNAHFCDSTILDQSWYKETIYHYFSKIAEKGLMMEINTKAFNNTGYFFPNESNFHLIKELDIPVMVNSDAHYPDKINDGRMEALKLLKKHGIQFVRELQQGEWKDVPIR